MVQREREERERERGGAGRQTDKIDKERDNTVKTLLCDQLLDRAEGGYITG